MLIHPHQEVIREGTDRAVLLPGERGNPAAPAGHRTPAPSPQRVMLMRTRRGDCSVCWYVCEFIEKQLLERTLGSSVRVIKRDVFKADGEMREELLPA